MFKETNRRRKGGQEMKKAGYIFIILGCISFVQQAFFLHHAVAGSCTIIAIGFGLLYFGKQKEKKK